MKSDTQCHLNNLGVLVTRPEQQALALCEAIEKHRGQAIRFPTIEIVAAADREQQLAQAGNYDDLLFISPNAVANSVDTLRPRGQRIIAIGDATAKRLEEAGIETDLVPGGSADSETLLASHALAEMHGRKVLIIRGKGGRALLGDTLRERGAEIDYAEVYERRCPNVDTQPLKDAWEQVDVIIATSNTILDNLLRLLGDIEDDVLNMPLIVISKRMADHAAKLGFNTIHRANSAASTQLLDTLCNLVGSTQDSSE